LSFSTNPESTQQTFHIIDSSSKYNVNFVWLKDSRAEKCAHNTKTDLKKETVAWNALYGHNEIISQYKTVVLFWICVQELEQFEKFGIFGFQFFNFLCCILEITRITTVWFQLRPLVTTKKIQNRNQSNWITWLSCALHTTLIEQWTM
jgi:hypothetical protein